MQYNCNTKIKLGKKIRLVQAAVTKYHKTRWLIKNRNLFLTVLEAEKSRMKAAAGVVPVGAASPQSSFPAQKVAGERPFLGEGYRSRNATQEGSTSCPRYFQRANFLPSSSGLEFQHRILGLFCVTSGGLRGNS